MQEKSIIKQNILKYLDYIGITAYKFYQESGITRGILSQNNGMSEENTARFLDCYDNVSPEWLITGKGDMLKTIIKEYPPPDTIDYKELAEARKDIIEGLKYKVSVLEKNLFESKNQFLILEKELNEMKDQITIDNSIRSSVQSGTMEFLNEQPKLREKVGK
jgi:hypothetical protein